MNRTALKLRANLGALMPADAPTIEQITNVCQANGMDVDTVAKCLMFDKALENCDFLQGDKLQLYGMYCHLPQYIHTAIENGTIQAFSNSLYKTIALPSGGAGSTRVWATADTLTEGTTNVLQAKLAQKQAFLCTGLRLGFGFAATPGEAIFWKSYASNQVAATPPTSADIQRIGNYFPPALVNGEMNLLFGTRTIVERFALSQFDNHGNNQQNIGYIKVPFPFVVDDTEEFKSVLNTVGTFAGEFAIPAGQNAYARVELCGVHLIG